MKRAKWVQERRGVAAAVVAAMRMLLGAAVLGGVSLGAQVYPYMVDTRAERGLLPNRSQLSGAIDHIDLKTGKMHLAVPLGSLPAGPAGSGFALALSYDSNLYDFIPEFVMGSPPDMEAHPAEILIKSPTGGWQYNMHYRLDLEQKEGASTTSDCEAIHARQFRARIELPDGSRHILHLRGHDAADGDQYLNDGWFGITPSGEVNDCTDNWTAAQTSGTLTYYTIDGSFLRLETEAMAETSWASVPWKLSFKDGRRAVSTGGTVATDYYDANNNRLRFLNVCNDPCTTPETVVRDASSREVRIQRSDVSATEKTHTITAPGPLGPVSWTVNWEAFTIGADGRQYKKEHLSDPNNPVLLPLSRTLWKVKYIQLPLERAAPMPGPPPVYNSYAFGYSDDADGGYGQVDAIRTPGGAQYAYVWSLESSAPTPPALRTEQIVHENRVTAKSLNHSGVSAPLGWTFARAYPGVDLTVTAPTGAQTTYTWDSSNHGGLSKIEGPLGTVTKRVWSQNVPYGAHEGDYEVPANIYVSREAVTVGNAGGMPAKTAVTDYSYDKNGNVTGTIEYDWVDYSTSAVETGMVRLRTTALTYWVTTGAASVETDDTAAYWHPSARQRLNAVRRRETGPGLVAVTEYEYDNAYTSGNLTAEKHWDDVKPASASAPALGTLSPANARVLTRAYDTKGNLTDIYAPDIRTHITYDAQTNYPIRVEYGYRTASERTWTYAWNSAAGTLTSKTDLDNGVSTAYVYDKVARPTSVTEANLRKTVTTYYDDTRRVRTVTDLAAFGDGKLQTETRYDQLGRVVRMRSSDGPALDASGTNGIHVETQYRDAQNQLPQTVVSTPYRARTGATVEWTCARMDLLGRTTHVAAFRGSTPPDDCLSTLNRTGVTTTAYDAATTTTTDPAGAAVAHVHDALGRLTRVIEAPDVLGYVTDYTYDPLDNLRTVLQGAQTRAFAYSSLSRLVSATNPESGTTRYAYDDAGNLTTRTDARNVTATYAYDGLHRILTTEYAIPPDPTPETPNDWPAPTPGVTYAYHTAGGGSAAHNIGQLRSITAKTVDTSTQTTVTMASSSYLYDALGRVASMSQTIAGNPDTFTFAADYYLNGALMYQTYPSGRRVRYTVDDAGRVARVAAGTRIYADMTTASPHAYHPDGRLQQMKLGNNLWEIRDYHTPGTTTRFKLVTPDETTMLPGAIERVALGYDYHPTANNGNLQSHLIRYDGGAFDETQEFRYDSLNRIEFAAESDGGYYRAFAYDRYGNRWVVANTGLTAADSHEPRAGTVFDITTNRMRTSPTMDYDAAGNQTIYVPYRLVYDAENRLVSMTSPSSGNAAYAYDAMGRRVKKTWTPGGGTATDTYYVYDIAGNLAAEYGTGTAPASGTFYPFVDLLGSVRTVTDAAGAVVECYDYLPFGRMLSSSDNDRIDLNCHPQSPDTAIGGRTSQKFTGQVRDEESRLDYFKARYMSAPQGRFLSPDDLFVDQSTDDPQSWNLYTYVRNNPLNRVDPSGLEAISREDCEEDPDCVIAQLTVILDEGASLYDDDGTLSAAFRTKLDLQVQKAKDDFGEFNIHLEVSVVTGEVRRGGVVQSGLVASTLNVVVTDSYQLGSFTKGYTAISEGYDLSFVNLPQAQSDTTAHEIAHHFAGDTTNRLYAGIRSLPVIGTLDRFFGATNGYTDALNDFHRQYPHFGNPKTYDFFNRGARRFAID